MSETPIIGDRLDSWKEIAAYLKRNERTVIRWERRGLPVRRVPGGQRNTVFAYKHELDDWLQQTESLVEPDDANLANGHTEPAKLQEKLKRNVIAEPRLPEKNSLGIQSILKRKRQLLAISIFVLALGVVAGTFLMHLQTVADIRTLHLLKLTEDGHYKTNLRTNGATLYFNEFEGAREILISMSVNGGSIHPINTSFANVELQDVSNDGQHLLVTSFEGIEPEKPLWIVPIRGGAPQRVGDILCHSARWSPNNRKIACATGTTIAVMNTDASGAFVVASFPVRPNRLIWSPDGKQLRFVLESNLTKDLSPGEVAVGKGVSNESPVFLQASLGANCCIDWDWRADNKGFAYTKNGDSRTAGIFLTPADRSFIRPVGRTTKVPVEIGYTVALTASKNENALYALIENVARGDSYLGELLKFDPRQKAFQTMLHGLSATYLAFSRDGQWMTYMSNTDSSLWRSRVDGTDALQLTKPPFEAQMSSWSPDGRRIAFMGKQPGKPWRIYLINRNGGTAEEIAPGSDNQGAPTWSPDGRSLVYGNVLCEEVQGCWIRRVNLAMKTTEMLPGSHGFRTARWSPDGRYIAALQPDNHELMLFEIKKRRWTMLADLITGDNLNWSSDSQSIYADSPHGENPIIERIRIVDGKREAVVDLSALQKMVGQADFWLGLAPDNSPILGHRFIGSEVYVLNWADSK